MPTLILHDASHRRRAHGMIDDAPDGHRVTVEQPKATNPQKRKMNAMCGEVAKQATYHGLKLDKDDWRHIFAASLFKLRIVPGIDNDGFVTLVPSTADMSIAQVSAMIERLYAFGAEAGVTFREFEETP